MMKIFLLAVLTVASAAGATEGAPIPAAPSPPSAAASSLNSVEHDGQTFELANRTSARNVETDEYVVAGENLETWTQLVTVQRLTLMKPMPTEAFVGYFQKRLLDENGATLEVLKQAKTAAVFAVRFSPSDRNEEQVMVCLAFVDPTNPALLNVVQYAIKPTRLGVDVVESRLKSWRDKLLRQAEAMSGERSA